MAGKGKAAIKELGEILIQLAQKGDAHEIMKIIESEVDKDFLKASINFRDAKSGIFPLIAAAIGNFQESVVCLLDNGADVNLMDRTGETVMMKLSDKGMLDMIAFLLDRGVDVNKLSGAENVSALMKACKKGHAEVVQYLLEHNAEVNVVDKSGWSALTYAAHAGHTTIVRALVEKSVNLDIVDEEAGWTALMYASRYGHTETVDALLQVGAHLEIFDRKRNTALLLACNNRHWTTVELLINRGVDINAQSDLGDTALMLACLRGSMSTVEALLAKGADLELVNKKGQRALDFAKQSDIKRALTTWQREHSPVGSTPTDVAPAIVLAAINEPAPQPEPLPSVPTVVVEYDICHRSFVQKCMESRDSLPAAGKWASIAKAFASSWSSMNAEIKLQQAEFVSSLAATSLASPSRDQDYQHATKYHTLLLRLWQETMTLLKFYALHIDAVTLLLSDEMLRLTKDSHCLWSIHLFLSTLANAPTSSGASPIRSELSVSQCLAMQLVLDCLSSKGSLDEMCRRQLLRCYEQLQPLFTSIQAQPQLMGLLFRFVTLRRACSVEWRHDTALSKSFVDRITDAQAQRRNQYVRFQPDWSETEYATVCAEEVAKITSSDRTRVEYVSAYNDITRLILSLCQKEGSGHFVDAQSLRLALSAEYADSLRHELTQNVVDCWNASLEAVVEVMTEVTKKRVPTESVAESDVTTTFETTARSKVLSDDHTQNPLHAAAMRATEVNAIDNYNESIKQHNTTASPQPTTNASARPAPASNPAQPALSSPPPKRESKCCCIVS